MRVGIIILPDQRWSVASRRWRLAEEYGFDSAWTYDHLGWRDLVDGPWFDAVTTLTAAAQVTSRIRLGTMVASPNFRHPVHFARELTGLDDISGGRITVGVGAGAGKGAFDELVLGGDELSPSDRVARFEEFVELLDLILRGDHVTWRGSWYASVDARSNPGCVQAPRLPFVVAANGPRSMRLAARFGHGWLTTGGRAPADDQDTWWRQVKDTAARFDEVLAGAGREPSGREPSGQESSSVERHLSLDAAPVFSLASVEAFADAVGRAGELGFTHAHTHWPRESSWYSGDEATLERVAAQVLPGLAVAADVT